MYVSLPARLAVCPHVCLLAFPACLHASMLRSLIADHAMKDGVPSVLLLDRVIVRHPTKGKISIINPLR